VSVEERGELVVVRQVPNEDKHEVLRAAREGGGVEGRKIVDVEGAEEPRGGRAEHGHIAVAEEPRALEEVVLGLRVSEGQALTLHGHGLGQGLGAEDLAAGRELEAQHLEQLRQARGGTGAADAAVVEVPLCVDARLPGGLKVVQRVGARRAQARPIGHVVDQRKRLGHRAQETEHERDVGDAFS